MRFVNSNGRIALEVTFVVALLLIYVATGRADEPLRWKFQPGQKLNYSIVQETTISDAEGDGSGKPDNKTRQQLDITWDVLRLNDGGEAVIRHRFDRIRSSMTLPAGGFEYDSAKEGPPSGMAAINAPLYAALVKSLVEISIASNGRMTSVKLPEGVEAALKRVPTAAAIGNLGKPAVFERSFLPGFPLLVDGTSIAPQKEWSTESMVDLATDGKQTIETSYRYEGRREVKGMDYAVIRPIRTISFEGGDSSKRTVKEQSSEGEILFDAVAGRLQSSTLKHHATISIAVGKHVTDQKIEQSIEVKLTTP